MVLPHKGMGQGQGEGMGCGCWGHRSGGREEMGCFHDRDGGQAGGAGSKGATGCQVYLCLGQVEELPGGCSPFH